MRYRHCLYEKTPAELLESALQKEAASGRDNCCCSRDPGVSGRSTLRLSCRAPFVNTGIPARPHFVQQRTASCRMGTHIGVCVFAATIRVVGVNTVDTLDELPQPLKIRWIQGCVRPLAPTAASRSQMSCSSGCATIFVKKQRSSSTSLRRNLGIWGDRFLGLSPPNAPIGLVNTKFWRSELELGSGPAFGLVLFYLPPPETLASRAAPAQYPVTPSSGDQTRTRFRTSLRVGPLFCPEHLGVTCISRGAMVASSVRVLPANGR